MVMKILIARCDGTRESGFAPGAIQSTRNVLLTRDFDPRQPPLGRCDVVVEGEKVYALIDDRLLSHVMNRYPAVGGRTDTVPAGGVFNRLELVTVGICASPNADPMIPAITQRGACD